jgi:hypothetical protein
MGTFAGTHPPQNDGMLHELRQLREMFADLNAWHGSGDRLEFAGIFGARLHVEGVFVGRSAVHPQKNAGFMPLL